MNVCVIIIKQERKNMLLLAKILAVAVVVWFYLAAQEHKQPPIKWAVIGLIGYLLGWFLTKGLLHILLPASASRTLVMGFLVVQIPAVCGAFAAFLIRGKLISDAVNQDTAQLDGE
jgi:RsiW-degrading membrane proteinase PrsW (M82 family)